MFREKSLMRGRVKLTVKDESGNLKKRVTWNVKVFLVVFVCLIHREFQNAKDMFKYEMAINHNIVTDHGDALIVDMLVTTGTKTAVDNTNGKMGIGTGYVSATKSVTALVTQNGLDTGMEATYPKQKGAFAATDDNVIQYRSIFTGHTATGIDEAALGNGTEFLAYAEVTPVVNLVPADTLQVDWEITMLGS